MRIARSTLCLLILAWLALQVVPLDAKEAPRPAAGPLITIHAPHATQFELAMDEAELDWSRVPGAKGRALGTQATPAGSARIIEREGMRARAAFAPVDSLSALQGMTAALQAANPGADAYLVVYEPGRPKSKATRRLLTREVGLVMEPGVDPHKAVAGLPVTDIRPVGGVSDGYVVNATDPIAALDLAHVLRQRSGVRHAYPLLRRQYVPR